MIAEHYALECGTRGEDHIVDLTDQVQSAVAESGVTTGQAALLVHGSTAALTTVEYEPGLVNHDISAARAPTWNAWVANRPAGRPLRARGDVARRQRPQPRAGQPARPLAGRARGERPSVARYLAADRSRRLRHARSPARRGGPALGRAGVTAGVGADLRRWRPGPLLRAATLEALVALAVDRQLTDFLEATSEAVEQPSMEPAVGGAERVMLPEPVLPDAHEPRATEVGEVP